MKHVVHIFRKHLCSLVYVWYINIRCMHDVRNVGIWSTNESLFIYLISRTFAIATQGTSLAMAM